MSGAPWWIDRVAHLSAGATLETLSAGELFHLSEGLQFVRENVTAADLAEDLVADPSTGRAWSEFAARDAAVGAALNAAVGSIASSMRSGGLGPESFRRAWEVLGFSPHEGSASTPADDYLDAVTQVSRLTLGEERPASGTLNMASRAERISDFLAVTRPGIADRVVDLGSGSGKFAISVAASAFTSVTGVELGRSYVDAARRSGAFLGLSNLGFQQADVRDVDLSVGSIFYLYYPFHGEVARAVARALGKLSREKEIAIYLHGPQNGFREHFLAEVDAGALVLSERRGTFSEVLVLRSARA